MQAQQVSQSIVGRSSPDPHNLMNGLQNPNLILPNLNPKNQPTSNLNLNQQNVNMQSSLHKLRSNTE